MRIDEMDARPAAERNETRSFEVESTAEGYLALLKQRGIDYLYVNAGTDFAPLIEAYARQEHSGLGFPAYVICAHENVALGMAQGYYLATGRAQVVMVHVSVGSANALCALMNAARENTPVLLAAGRTPIFENARRGARSLAIHWGQEMFDQAGMLREVVKWDYELRDGQQLAEVVDRALAISMAPPRGPVYLTLPREVLAQPMSALEVSAMAPAVPTDPAPDPAAVDELLRSIEGARFPVFLVNEAGRDPADMVALVELAERLGVGVVESNKALCVSIPTDHELHLGCDVAPVLAEADVLVVLATEVPWVPTLERPRAGAKVIQVGVDPLFSRIPMRSFPADLAVTASTKSMLAALRQRAPAEARGAADRRSRLEAFHASVRRARSERLIKARSAARIDRAMLNACLDAVKPPEAIVFNEYWVDRNLVDFTEPGTCFRHSIAGGLGWGLPAALGLQQADRNRLVIAALGDGAYVFANPAACHMVAAAERLAVLTVILNNRQWDGVKRGALQVYPNEHAAKQRVVPMSSLEPAPAYERYVEASGGCGMRVEKPEEIEPVLRHAIEIVMSERRQVVVNVISD